MKQKNGFMATSLIYSFFLVFLMLMVGILAKNASNRILLDAIKDDIRNKLNEDTAFVIDLLEKRNYSAGEVVSFAGESWKVLTASDSSATTVLLGLNRALTGDEIKLSIGKEFSNTEFFGTCNASSCRVRSCRNAASGQEYCYYYPANNRLHTKPSWLPSISQVHTQDYGRTIVSMVVNNWLHTNQGLQRAMDKSTLIPMTFSDGYMNVTGYIRTPICTNSNMTECNNLGGTSPYHLLNSVGPSNELLIRIFNGTIQEVNSNTDAFIIPVITVKKAS